MNFETPTKDGAKLADGEHQALPAELAEARVFIGASNLFEPIEELQFEDGGQLKRETQDTASVLELGAAGGVMQAKVTNADKAIGEDMREETADKLEDMQGHQLFFAIVAVIEILEGDGILANVHNAVIGNGNAEDVTTEILDQFLFVIERGLDIDFPIFGQGLLEHELNIESAVVGVEFAVCPKLGEGEAKAIAELIGKQFSGEEELRVSGMPSVACGRRDQCAARNDEVEVQMLLHGLPPGVHDHREANLAAQIFPSKLLQQLSRNLDEQIEEHFLIERHQRIENMVDREDDVKIMDG